MAAVNSFVGIASLILDDGEMFWDGAAVLDYRDEQVAPDAALARRSGEVRRKVLRATILAARVAEKAGAVAYERHLHKRDCVSTERMYRCPKPKFVRIDPESGGTGQLWAGNRGPLNDVRAKSDFARFAALTLPRSCKG